MGSGSLHLYLGFLGWPVAGTLCLLQPGPKSRALFLKEKPFTKENSLLQSLLCPPCMWFPSSRIHIWLLRIQGSFHLNGGISEKSRRIVPLIEKDVTQIVRPHQVKVIMKRKWWTTSHSARLTSHKIVLTSWTQLLCDCERMFKHCLRKVAWCLTFYLFEFVFAYSMIDVWHKIEEIWGKMWQVMFWLF